MLRKIVNMLMGSAAPERNGVQTHFESLLSRVVEQGSPFEGESDPLEALSTAVMNVAAGEDVANAQAARAYFSVLVENDRLPAGEQLDQDELELLKNLLVEYFSGDNAVRVRANEVLGLIERKFSQGAFTQAKILLQIFETDAETRLNNERNLFYEDMIMRLGMRRRHVIPESEVGDIQTAASRLKVTADEAVKDTLDWLGQEYYVHFALAVRDPDQVGAWDKLASGADIDARGRLLRYVPPLRWRRPSGLTHITCLDQSELHLTPDAIKSHVQRLFKMCYFLLLASGDTGFEDYVYAFLAWSRSTLSVEAKSLLPLIHRRSVLEECGLQETLDLVFEEHYAEPLAKRIEDTDRSLEDAWNAVFANLGEYDVNSIPPGHYDIGGFLLDELLEFEQPDKYFGFKLYRLS